MKSSINTKPDVGEMHKPKILVFSEYYRPGYKSGGGMRTIVNMVDRLHDHYDFRVVTHDHDGPMEKHPYREIALDNWIDMPAESVYYVSRNNVSLRTIRQLICDANPDLIYSNSFFSRFTLLLMLLRRINAVPKTPVVVAPCGELSTAALARKGLKKRGFLGLAKWLGMYSDVSWKASNQAEVQDIKAVGLAKARYAVAPDLTATYEQDSDYSSSRLKKFPGELRLIYLSRIVPKKNLAFFLKVLSRVTSGNVTLDIYGPEEDPAYSTECRQVKTLLPENVDVNFLGPIAHEKIASVLSGSHFFVLPTLNENFGHVIIEALAAGCPLLISNQTPWTDLDAKGIGWDLPLDDPEMWLHAVDRCVSMDKVAYRKFSVAAHTYAVKWMAENDHLRMTMDMLEGGLLDSSRRGAPRLQ